MTNRSVLALAVLLWPLVSPLHVTRAQDEAGPRVQLTSPSSQTLSGGEEKELRKKLELARDVPIKVVNVDQAASLVIAEASVRGAERQQPPANAEPMINDYAMSARIVVTNKDQSEVTGLGFRFTSKETTFYVYYWSISLKAGKSGLILINFMCVSGEPSSLTIQLTGAERGKGRTWGEFPLPSLSATHQSSQQKNGYDGANEPATTSVTDNIAQKPVLPVLLNSPRPQYTERARKNRIMGAALLKVLIGEDGRVKRVAVIRSLPDFLTEAAISTAFELKFKPATIQGKAVAFWRSMVVDFDLK